ncbi:MAG: deoxyribose-phosphate aldolase, partial [Planctomycetota bacterium]
MDTRRLASAIEHTLLKAEAAAADVDRLCEEADRLRFHAVCVPPRYVRQAAKRLEALRSDVRVVSVAGFPLGGSRTETKADEAARAMDDGAVEIDMVPPIGALRAGDRSEVRQDIEAVARIVHGRFNGILKVILETAALTDAQIVLGCRLCMEGEADFVKTSTGFHPAGGATVEAVRLLHRHAAPMQV